MRTANEYVADELGKLAYSHDLFVLQRENFKWGSANFGDQDKAELMLLGVGEELGELNHAVVKLAQGIRGDQEQHIAAARDAVGDVVIYLAAFCNAMMGKYRVEFSLSDCVEDAWCEVRARDWQANPEDGHVAAS